VIFSAATLALATRGRLVADGPAGPVTTDSRRVVSGDWFVALAGDKFDGHAFLGHARAAGCAGAVVSREPEGWDRGLVVVSDPLVALQDLARHVRSAFRGAVVGITGSAGKTSTRTMVVDVLASLGRVHHTEGNLNNHVGLPLTLVATPPDADVLVLELGMNHPGEIALLQDIAQPTVRLITNVGPAHVEGCGSIEGVARAKQELFDGARPGDICCVNLDDPFIRAMPVPAGARAVGFGTGPDAPVRLTDVSVDPATLQTRLRVETPDGVVRATLDVPGAHLALNAAAAVAVGWSMRVPCEAMGAALSRFAPVGMRNRVERIGGAVVLDDAYNANPLSVAAALRTLAALPGRRVAALGDMLELGADEAAAHRDVLALACSLGIDRVLVTGPRLAAAAGPGVEVFEDAEALAAAIPLAPDLCLLVKGSRGARMERVLAALRARV
jgi:UDP-N-acetylmuramoyl-tripeptide--D-alanyl-D-alanine ligase